MPNYAISDGSTIVNVIVADSKKIAEELSGMTAIETNGSPWMNWTLKNGEWTEPPPYPSWTKDGDNWVAPVPKPEQGGYYYMWNEEKMGWDAFLIPKPFPSWIRNENNDWVAPVPYPQDGQPYFWDENIINWKLKSNDLNQGEES